MVNLPADEGPEALRAVIEAFPRRELNAYGLKFHDDDPSVLTFRTAERTPKVRVQDAITKWIDAPTVLAASRCL